MKFTFFSFNKKSVLKQLLEDLSYMVMCSVSVLEKIRIMSKYTKMKRLKKSPSTSLTNVWKTLARTASQGTQSDRDVC